MITRIGWRLSTSRGGIGGLAFSWLIAGDSGKLGPPQDIAGLQLNDHVRHTLPLIAARLAQALAKRPEPARDLLEAVQRRHIWL